MGQQYKGTFCEFSDECKSKLIIMIHLFCSNLYLRICFTNRLTLPRVSECVDVGLNACAVYVHACMFIVFFALNCHMLVGDGSQTNKSVRSLQLKAEIDTVLYVDRQALLWLCSADSIISIPGPVCVTAAFPDCHNE